MTEQEIQKAIQETATRLAGSLADSLEAAKGPKVIQIIYRQPFSESDLTKLDAFLVRPTNEVRNYLNAWPDVEGLQPTGTSNYRIYHQEQLIDHKPLPDAKVYYAFAPTETGKVETISLWNSRINAPELIFSIECSVN